MNNAKTKFKIGQMVSWKYRGCKEIGWVQKIERDAYGDRYSIEWRSLQWDGGIWREQDLEAV